MPHIADKHVLWTEKNGIVTVQLLATGAFFELNSLGSIVWKLLASGKSVDAAIESMAKTYDVTREQLALDVHAFVVKMIAAGLLEA